MKHSRLSRSCHCLLDQVPLGVLLLNENKLPDMCKILETLQQYVPSVPVTRSYHVGQVNLTLEDSDFCKVLFGGDQLTAARARGPAALRDSHNTSHDRLEGFEAVIEDWHARLAFAKVIKFWYMLREVVVIQCLFRPFGNACIRESLDKIKEPFIN